MTSMSPERLIAQRVTERLGIRKIRIPEQDNNLIAWAEAHFYLGDTQELLTFYPSQKAAALEATRRDAEGNYLYNTVLWSWPKKSAKSTIVAAVADWVASTRPRSSIKVVANDLKQADSRVGQYLRESIKAGRELEQDKLVRDFRRSTKIMPSGYRIEYPNGSVIEMIPIDPTGEAGGNDTMTIYSELWGWASKKHQKMWAEMTLSANKFGKAQRWIDTYAGFIGESPVLEFLWELIVKDANRLALPWPYEPVEAYAAHGNFATWVTVPHLPWQSKAYYASEAINLTPAQFNRMHRNIWEQSTDTFIDSIAWDACYDPELRLDPDEVYTMGVDAGITNDTFAIVLAGKKILREADEDTPELSIITVPYVKVYIPNGNEPLDFLEPETLIRELCNSYNVHEVAYDPYQLHDMMLRLKRERVARTRPFSQGADRAKADKALRDMIIQRRFAHNGDAVLRQHALNANAKINTGADQLRIDKKNNNMKVDALVATSMTAARRMRLNA